MNGHGPQRFLDASRTGHFLRGLLLAAVALPPLALVYGTRDDRVVFVLYREPKLALTQILGWSLLAALFWTARNESLLSTVAAVLRRRLVLRVLVLLLVYMAVTVLWVEVPENLFYELNQYLLLVLVLLGLCAWAERDRAVRAIVQYGIVVSLAVATLVGIVQLVMPMDHLIPIHPQSGVSNPSLMGYKNPMALSLLGQVFLLAALVFAGDRGTSRIRRFFLAALLGTEVLYLAHLESRTSYMALLTAAIFLLVVFCVRERSRRRIGKVLLLGALGIVVFLGVLAISETTRHRAASVLPYLRNPAAYLESDRGTYLLNTLNMVRHNPLGVGLGDWQTHYPVYRLHKRNLSFSNRNQLRRAHSDHVQWLGETGWPGLGLWWVFLFGLVTIPTRRYLRRGDRRALFLAAQLVAFAAAMATDYVLELPYNKLQFFLVAFLALSLPTGGPRRCAASTRPSRAALAAAGLLTAVAVVNVCYYGSLLRKLYLSAAINSTYMEVQWSLRQRTPPSGLSPGEAALLRRTALYGREFERTPGYAKTFHKDYLVLAQTAFLLGRRSEALAYGEKSLSLQPYHPNVMSFMAVLLRTEDPEEAEMWQRAHDYVMEQATRGFEIPYPGTRERRDTRRGFR